MRYVTIVMEDKTNWLYDTEMDTLYVPTPQTQSMQHKMNSNTGKGAKVGALFGAFIVPGLLKLFFPDRETTESLRIWFIAFYVLGIILGIALMIWSDRSRAKHGLDEEGYYLTNSSDHLETAYKAACKSSISNLWCTLVFGLIGVCIVLIPDTAMYKYSILGCFAALFFGFFIPVMLLAWAPISRKKARNGLKKKLEAYDE